MAERPRILLIDDGEAYATAITERMPDVVLIDPGVADGIPRLPDGPAAIKWLNAHRHTVDVILLDMRFDVPDERLLEFPEGRTARRRRRFQGVAILRSIRKKFPEIPVVVLTAVEDLSLVDVGDELAAQSLTYVLDGEDLDAVRIRVHTALQDRRRASADGDILWGQDTGMRAVRRRMAVLARGRLSVIIEGETGTGKSFLAERWLHERSGRSGPFVVLDLATIPTDLIPAHLFGATRGAYTGAVTDRKGVFELANEGTLFIDEIQNVPLEVQKQLLLVLQDRKVRPLGAAREVPVDVKVVAASNRPLGEAVRAGRFRPDLYMRLSPATRVLLPPLRDRPADLSFLAREFVQRALRDPDIGALVDQVAEALRLSKPGIELVVGREPPQRTQALQIALPRPAWLRLTRHRWPGNLRELEMVMHNIVTFTLVAAVDAIAGGAALRSARLQVDSGLVGDLLAGVGQLPQSGDEETPDPDTIRVRISPARTLNAVSTDVERQYFLGLFEQTNREFSAMAERLLGDPERGRAIRLRFNQLGLKVRELRKT